MTDPYPQPVVIPYDPEDPDLPEPVDAPPPPERVHMTAKEANAAAAEADLDSGQPPG